MFFVGKGRISLLDANKDKPVMFLLVTRRWEAQRRVGDGGGGGERRREGAE